MRWLWGIIAGSILGCSPSALDSDAGGEPPVDAGRILDGGADSSFDAGPVLDAGTDASFPDASGDASPHDDPTMIETPEGPVLVPETGLYVELRWHTPGDSDESDEGAGVGANVDVHLTHELATGPDVDGDSEPDPWFNALYDCFWYNPAPNWGLPGETADNPSLDRDDRDGAGPELAGLDAPESGVQYRIGVHYWNAYGYGNSEVTIRVFVDGEPVFMQEALVLAHRAMWTVGTLDWDTREFVPALDESNAPLIYASYENPYFPLD